jgi:teichuronic acid biosynthesis glycosyltransferase TuaC
MRILFFSTAFPQPDEPSRNPDNLERCAALARHHDVHVISPFSWLRLASGIPPRQEAPTRGFTVSRPMFCYPPGALRAMHAWCMWQGVRRTTLDKVRAFQPEAVLSYWTYPDTAVATAIARLAGAPCVAIVGGSDVLSIDPAAPGAAGHRARRVLEGVDAIAAVSDSIKDRIAALGISPRKIDVLGAAVDRTIFVPGSRHDARRRLDISGDAQVLMWVGRMVPVKALDLLLDAVVLLRPDWPNLRLYLIGDGPLRRSLEAKVAARQLANHVTFVGRVSHRDLPDYYRAADLTVLPSEWEGMPNALIESHACGTPFVASTVGAAPQLAQADLDELVAPGDREQLAIAIATALKRRSGARQSAICNAAGWEQMAEQLAALMQSARRSRAITVTEATPAPPRLRTRLRPNRRHSWRAS